MLYNLITNNILKTKINININYIFNIGFILSVSIIIQIISGILLSLYYSTNSILSDLSMSYTIINYIDREIINGLYIRNIHSIGVTLIYILLYIHIYKSLYYSSYIIPRNSIYLYGIYIWLLLIIISFLGYSIAIGNQSYWAISVITKLLTIIPYIGNSIVSYIWGSLSINAITLNRYYSFHYLLPFILLYLIILHIICLHYNRGNNVLSLNTNTYLINFNYLFTIKDLYTILIYILILLYISSNSYIYYIESDNKNIYNIMITPLSIVPHWYLLPYYSILRAINNKLIGVISMLLSILILLILSYNNLSYIKYSRFRLIYKYLLYSIIYIFLILLSFGSKPLINIYIIYALLHTIIYFNIITILIPIVGLIDNYIYYKI